MADTLQGNLKRLERLLQIHQTYVSVAEARVKQAEEEVRRLKDEETRTVDDIHALRTGIAHLQKATGHDIQASEKHIQLLQRRLDKLLHHIDTTVVILEERRKQWTEAMQEQEVVMNVKETRLREWEHERDRSDQKAQDEVSIGRYVRARINARHGGGGPKP